MSSYHKIPNLYKDQTVLMFKEVFATEKVDGTSSYIVYNKEKEKLVFYGGCANQERFNSLFNHQDLTQKLSQYPTSIKIFGEAYGGKIQGMSESYGKELQFIAFEVKIGDVWLSVDAACAFCEKLGIEFVPYIRIPATIEMLNQQRDADSAVAIRRGMGFGKKREGIVIRPIIEMMLVDGERVIAKHKREEFRETKTVREVEDPAKRMILEKANEIADEYVVPMRLDHVLSKLPTDINIEHTPMVIKAMINDVELEASGEIVVSKEARSAIGKKTALLFKQHLRRTLNR